MKPSYKRVLFKVSGQSMAGEGGFGISTERIQRLAREVADTGNLAVAEGMQALQRRGAVVGRRRERPEHGVGHADRDGPEGAEDAERAAAPVAREARVAVAPVAVAVDAGGF